MPKLRPTPPIDIPSLAQSMVFVEGGSFEMGDKNDSKSKPVHRAKVQDFYISRFLVTQALWGSIMQGSLSHFSGAHRPVEQVAWDEVQNFIQVLNQKQATFSYALPSEAQWEYAARGGKYRRGLSYAGSNRRAEVAWYDKNAHQESQAVGLKLPNALGLFDMSGNLWEWCVERSIKRIADTFKNITKDTSKVYMRVAHGGSWSSYDTGSCLVTSCLVDLSGADTFDIGFRLIGYKR